MWGTWVKKIISFVTLVTFVVLSVAPSYAQTALLLPEAGQMIGLSAAFNPVVLRGIKVDPQDPFKFDFLVDPGESGLQGDEIKEESIKLIRYFLASITTPEKDLWVNLSPYEQDRIVPDAFGTTEMGRDLLAQDYILKQITSSLMYPENEPGKAFWQEVYKQAYDLYGTTDVPMDTFNKVWIAPDKAVVYEDDGVAFIGESHLKVMLESDYLAMEKNTPPVTEHASEAASTSELTKGIIRSVMLPVIEKEVNEGKNFAQLRQVYQSLILAAWYKKRLKDSIFSKVYADQNKVAGVDVEDKDVKQKIFAQYVEAFKKGAYNYIKEEYDQYTQELIPRKYFSGGANFAEMHKKVDSKPMALVREAVHQFGRKLVMVAMMVSVAQGLFANNNSAASDTFGADQIEMASSNDLGGGEGHVLSGVLLERKVKAMEKLESKVLGKDFNGLHIDTSSFKAAQESKLDRNVVEIKNNRGEVVYWLHLRAGSNQFDITGVQKTGEKSKRSFNGLFTDYTGGATRDLEDLKDELNLLAENYYLTNENPSFTKKQVSLAKSGQVFFSDFKSNPDGLVVSPDDWNKAASSGLPVDTIPVKDFNGVVKLNILVRSYAYTADVHFEIADQNRQFKWSASNNKWRQLEGGVYTADLLLGDQLSSEISEALFTNEKAKLFPFAFPNAENKSSKEKFIVNNNGAKYEASGYADTTDVKAIQFAPVASAYEVEFSGGYTGVGVGVDISGSLASNPVLRKKYIDFLKRSVRRLAGDLPFFVNNMAVQEDIKEGGAGVDFLIKGGSQTEALERLDDLANSPSKGATNEEGSIDEIVKALPSGGLALFGTDGLHDIFANKTGDPQEMMEIFKKKTEEHGWIELAVKKQITLVFFSDGKINELLKQYMKEKQAEFQTKGQELKVIFIENSKEETDLLATTRSVKLPLDNSNKGTFNFINGAGGVIYQEHLSEGPGEWADWKVTDPQPVQMTREGELSLDIGSDVARVSIKVLPGKVVAPVSVNSNFKDVHVVLDGSGSMNKVQETNLSNKASSLFEVGSVFGRVRSGSVGPSVFNTTPTDSLAEILANNAPSNTNLLNGLNEALKNLKQKEKLLVSDLKANTGDTQLDMSVEDMVKAGIIINIATTKASYNANYSKYLTLKSNVRARMARNDLEFNASSWLDINSASIPIEVRLIAIAEATGGKIYWGENLADAIAQYQQLNSASDLATPSAEEQRNAQGGLIQITTYANGQEQTRVSPYEIVDALPVNGDVVVADLIKDDVAPTAGVSLATLNGIDGQQRAQFIKSYIKTKFEAFNNISRDNGGREIFLSSENFQLAQAYINDANRTVTDDGFKNFLLDLVNNQSKGVIGLLNQGGNTNYAEDMGQPEQAYQAYQVDKGGIDLNTDKLDLEIKGDGSAAIRAIDPALFAQFQAAPGLIPVIINIQPVNDLPRFLGLSQVADAAPTEATI